MSEELTRKKKLRAVHRASATRMITQAKELLEAEEAYAEAEEKRSEDEVTDITDS